MQSSLLTSLLKKSACAAALFALATSGWGQTVSFTGTYTQNFDSMGTSGTTPPTGWSLFMGEGGNNATWSSSITANGSTLSVASMVATTGALTVNNAPTATQINGYNAQGSSSSDRVIATSPTGVTGNAIQLRLVNNTGATLTGIQVGYDIRRYTAASTANELPGYQLFYSTDGGTTWVNVSALNPTISGSTGVIVPNTVGVTTVALTTVTLSSSVAAGSELRLRWVDDNAQQTSPDQIIGLDNVTITAVTSTGPTVSITSPANSASFIPGSSIAITASASESGGTVTNVAFFSGSTKLGNVASAPYSYTWSSVPAGSYALTAVAADAGGILATSAVGNITVAHLAPTVAITSPSSGAAYTAPASISLTATASDTDGNVTNVAFYQGSTLLANVASAPYSYTWTSVAAGSYTLTAVASVDTGASATSTGVSVTVTNLPNPLVASFTGSYSENFDLDLTNSTTTMPAGFQAMGLPGDHFLYTNGVPITSNAIVTATAGTAALTVWNVGTAVAKAGSTLFNIGCWDSLNDRALGTDPTGNAGTVIQLALTNNTGSALNGVIFSYTEKCLTNGSTSNGSYTDDGTERLELPGYSFFYSLTGDTNATNWFEVNALCLTNWVQGTSSDSGPVAITFPTPLPANGVMYFRWADDNCVASSPDQMYAIDNISIAPYNPVGPQVSFGSPTNNQNIIPETAFPISLNVSDVGSTITNVTLYVGGSPVYTFSGAPYYLPVPAGELPIGSYALSAVAMDAAGLSATSSVVNITVAYVPPTVSLTSPASGNSYPAPASIPLSASAASADGTVTNVAFYQGTTLLANVTSAPFNYTWANVFAGSYNLTALATDSHGLTATSSVVTVTVTNGYGVPLVSIASPANNANFLPNSSIAITATASESGGTLTNVEFYANATDLGGAASTPYSLTWPSVPAGVYALTAVADDSAGNSTTSAVVNITVSVPNVPPTVSLTSPTNHAAFNAPASISLSATASDSDGTVTNVAFYQGTTLLANVTAAPYLFTWTNVSSGVYALSAVATDNSGASTASSVANVTVANLAALQTLQQIKTVFVIALENHDWVQQNPQGSPQQVFGNPAAPYVNSLTTPGNSNAVQVSYATHYYNVASGEHPSEPNYIWAEAGTEFGTHTDNDPSTGSGNLFTCQHLSGQLTAAGIPWRSYQEDVEYSSSSTVSASGGSGWVNPYNGTTQYSYAVKHNPMAFFTDTQNKNCYPLTNLWTDLTNNNVGRYNWITPDQYNEMHSSLPSGYTYHGVAYTGDQAAIAEGDNALSIIIPKIMASAAYQDHGVIIIWTDETESTDDTNTTLPYIIISPLAKGNAYASTLPYSHSSDLKTMDELFGLAYQTNAIPAASIDAQNTGYNYVDGHSAVINDLSDFFQPANLPAPALTVQQNGTTLTNGANALAFGAVSLGANVSSTFTVTNTGSASLVLSNIVATGVNAVDFTVSSITLPATVLAGGSATFNLVFAPSFGGLEDAALQITDNDTNNDPFTLALAGTGVLVPPTVSLTSPANGASFSSPASLTLTATAADIDGTVTNVAFFQGTTLLGNATGVPFIFTTANFYGGSYTLTAVATDNNGLSNTSSVVNVTVTAPTLTVQQSGSPLANGGSATSFGAVNLGANAGSTFTVTNNGNSTLTITNIFATGANAGDFTIGGISLPAMVLAGQSTSFNVVFAPLGAGARAATLQITDNDVNNNPFTLALTGTGVLVPPTVSLTAPANGASFAAPAMLALAATAADIDGTVTNVAFYQGTALLGNATSAPFTFTTANLFAGSYGLTAVATDNNGLSSTSSVVNVTVTNTATLSVLQSIKTVFIIAMENHDLVQKNPTGNPQQILGNPAAPYFNSLITPGNSNAVQTAWATHMFSCAINGEHPSEPNYIWQEAGTDFGIRTDNDPNSPATSHNVFTNVMHLSGQLTAAGIPWRSYQEDLEYTTSEEVSASGSGKPANPYNGTTQYNYGVKHNPMAFFADTQNKNCYPMTNFWTDLTNNNIGRYNWITPDQYNEWHSALSGGYTYQGVHYTSDQAAIASGDNALSIIIPKIMASAAYQDHGVIIIWTDETESTDDTNTTLPYVIISPLAKGNAYASTLPYSHASDMKTMDEIFGLAYQTNAIPAAELTAQNVGYNYIDGHSAPINDLSDFFKNAPPVAGAAYFSRPANVSLKISISDLLTNVSDVYGYPITFVGVGSDGLNLTSTNGTTLFTNSTYIFYTNSVTPNVNDSFEYTVSDGHGGTAIGQMVIILNNNIVGQSNVKLNVSSTNVTANFFGWPGFQYTVQRSTNLTQGSGWVSISTNTAPASGLIQVQDGFQDLGIPVPPGPASAYYRLRYNP